MKKGRQLHSVVLCTTRISTGSNRHPSATAENKAHYTDLLDTLIQTVPLDDHYEEVCIKQLAQHFRLDPRIVLEGFSDNKEDSSIIPEDLSPFINILSLTREQCRM